MTPVESPPDLTPIPGGFHIKTLPDGRCVDVLRMIFNWRLVLSQPGHEFIDAAWCYYGHGDGRTMQTAFTTAVLAAHTWNGEGEPDGYDKRAL